MDSKELEQQLIDLQARIAFQEDMIQALNTTVAEQDKTLLTLQQRLKRWESKLDDMAYTLESSAPASEKPPHY